MTRKALGKGVSALLGERRPSPPPPAQAPPAVTPAAHPAPAVGVREIDVALVEPNPYQPRTTFPEAALAELANSIRATGVVQPILVRPLAGRFQLVAGERRWRAAKLAEKVTVPAMVRDVPDSSMLEITLVENLQREDLNPIEQARAYQALLRQLKLTQEQAAERTGKDRTTVANLLRLLRLPDFLQEEILKGTISGGHARALLPLEDRPQVLRVIADRIVKHGLSVRAVERMVASLLERRPKKAAPLPDPNVKAAIEEMQRALGTRVEYFQLRGGRARIVIECASLAEVERVYQRITRSGA